jgi:hypothetical protein
MFVERPEAARSSCAAVFRLKPGERVLMVEDVVTTGLSSREAIEAIEDAGGEVVAAAALVDRSGGDADLGVPFFPLIASTSRPMRRRAAAGAGGDPGGQAREPEEVTATLRLGVNIDHVATIRNARGGDHPDPVRAAEMSPRCRRRRHHRALARGPAPHPRRGPRG